MSNITAALVKELRERTGAPMMKCKKFLVEANGDIEEQLLQCVKQILLLQQNVKVKSLLKARLRLLNQPMAKKPRLLKLTETDFVGGGDDLKSFADRLAQAALDKASWLMWLLLWR